MRLGCCSDAASLAITSLRESRYKRPLSSSSPARHSRYKSSHPRTRVRLCRRQFGARARGCCHQFRRNVRSILASRNGTILLSRPAVFPGYTRCAGSPAIPLSLESTPQTLGEACINSACRACADFRSVNRGQCMTMHRHRVALRRATLSISYDSRLCLSFRRYSCD